jgi:hypothetical protein
MRKVEGKELLEAKSQHKNHPFLAFTGKICRQFFIAHAKKRYIWEYAAASSVKACSPQLRWTFVYSILLWMRKGNKYSILCSLDCSSFFFSAMTDIGANRHSIADISSHLRSKNLQSMRKAGNLKKVL